MKHYLFVSLFQLEGAEYHPLTTKKNAKNLEKRGKIRKKRQNQEVSVNLPLLTGRDGYAPDPCASFQSKEKYI